MASSGYEYLLECSISSEVVSQLLERLRCITDTHFSNGSAFKEQTRIYMLRGSGSACVTVYCKRPVVGDGETNQWQIRYLGLPEPLTSVRKPVLMRSCIMSTVEGNCFDFLKDLGFRISNEYILHGHLFIKGKVSITVAQVLQSTKPEESASNVTNVSPSHLVQARLLAGAGSASDVDHLWSVADLLKPLVDTSAWKTTQ